MLGLVVVAHTGACAKESETEGSPSLGSVVHLVDDITYMKPWTFINPRMVPHTYKSWHCEVVVRGSEVQDQPCLYIVEFVQPSLHETLSWKKRKKAWD